MISSHFRLKNWLLVAILFVQSQFKEKLKYYNFVLHNKCGFIYGLVVKIKQ